MREKDFVTNILVRRIEKVSDAVDLVRSLEEKFFIQDAPLSSSIFSRSVVSNEMTLMIDLDRKEDFIRFLSQVRNLGIIKLKFHYIFISLAINEINLSNFRQDRLSITGFSIVDYKNYKVAKQIGDTIQTSVPFNKITPIPVKF